MRKFWIGTSWKMNKTHAEAMAFCDVLSQSDMIDHKDIQSFVIPPFVHLRDVKNHLKDTAVKVGAQNMHWDDAGAWTGEISPLMLKDCATDVVEIGHSERREFFGETNETVGKKVEAAVRHGMIPLICLGETLDDKNNGRAEDVLKEEVEMALGYLDKAQKQSDILLAYEPVWAIGEHGIPASPEYANQQHKMIKHVAEQCLGRAIPCLYGGSVNPDNCEELIMCEHIDGLFIGRSAWQADGYINILKKCAAKIQ